MKDKKCANVFHEILKESNKKPSKIWVDKGSVFYNRSMKSWLEKNGIEMYSMHNEGKSVIAERFIRTLKNKIYKYMFHASVSKNVYIDKLDDIVNEYNNTYQNIIKMKPIDVKSNTYIESSKEINNKDPKFKIGDTVRTAKYQNIFAQGYTSNWSKEVFVIKKIKNTGPWTNLIDDLNGEEIFGTFYENELQKPIKKSLEPKKQSGKKMINYMLNGKDKIICLIVG